MPDGWDHERLTAELIRSEEMQEIWRGQRPPLEAEDIIKLAVGPKKLREVDYSDWEAILSEIIVGDALGADRIDYLLRDSHHAGVAYGGFDHHRLIDTLRILPRARESDEPALGIEEGGLHSAEALLLARYFMFTQVYFHPVRRIYDHHLKDFLREWTAGEGLPIETDRHLELTDHEVYAAILEAARGPDKLGHEPARRLVDRGHFKEVYRRNPPDLSRNPDAPELVARALAEELGDHRTTFDHVPAKGSAPDYPVLMPDERIVSSLGLSEVLETLPSLAIDFIFVDPEVRQSAGQFLRANRERIIHPVDEEETNREAT